MRAPTNHYHLDLPTPNQKYTSDSRAYEQSPAERLEADMAQIEDASSARLVRIDDMIQRMPNDFMDKERVHDKKETRVLEEAHEKLATIHELERLLSSAKRSFHYFDSDYRAVGQKISARIEELKEDVRQLSNKNYMEISEIAAYKPLQN